MSLAVRRRRNLRPHTQLEQKKDTIAGIIDDLSTTGFSEAQRSALKERAAALLPRLPRFLEMNGRLMIEALQLPEGLGTEAAQRLALAWEIPPSIKVKEETAGRTRAGLLRYYLALEKIRRELESERAAAVAAE
jgi:hypothetical protein